MPVNVHWIRATEFWKTFLVSSTRFCLRYFNRVSHCANSSLICSGVFFYETVTQELMMQIVIRMNLPLLGGRHLLLRSTNSHHRHHVFGMRYQCSIAGLCLHVSFLY